jgi:DNA-binding CsgD family transcriptional regulator
MDAESDNLHDAIAWALLHDVDLALRLGVALSPWWLLRGRWGEGRSLLQRAVAAAGDHPAEVVAAAEKWIARFSRRIPDYPSAPKPLERLPRARLCRRAQPPLEPSPRARTPTPRTTAGRGHALTEAVEFARAALVRDVPAPSDSGTPAGPKLSARERELLVLVAEGLTDNQIAEKLFISVRTVRSHLDRIRDKTGYRRRAELTRLAISTQLT